MADQIARIDADLRQLEDEKRRLAPPRTRRCGSRKCGGCANYRSSQGEKLRRITAAGVREFGSVRQWMQSRTVARPDGKVRPAAV
jgi:hypothetical protein